MAKADGKRARVTAETMASRQREISVSEFFTKNRHLLGFDNPAKALLTAVKEAVDNSLDACEEAHILPSLKVEIIEVSETRFRLAVEDNGPGIVKAQIPKIFAKLLYGSKFHRLKQSRGQQGIGISAAGLYGQLTTGKPMVITSKTGKRRPAHRVEVMIDTVKNQPKVLSDDVVEWEKDHGTRVELELTGAYRGGRTGVDAYIEQTLVANPHVEIDYQPPKGEARVSARATDEMPRDAEEIKPHPHGVELGMLMRMLHDARGQKVKGALSSIFSRVSPATAEKVCRAAGVASQASATTLPPEDMEKLHTALGEVKVMAPPSSCVVPVGEELIKAGLERRYNADFYVATTRPPAVYRGNPFVVEAGLAYGGDLPTEESAQVLRFANRVPLQYQPRACAITEAVYQTNWRNYTLSQPKGSLPVAPMAVFVHLASVWVPFTSEAKEAVAHYDEVMREIRFALQECGRKLASHVRAQKRAQQEAKRRSLFERYIPELGISIGRILGKPPQSVEKAFYGALPNFVRDLPTPDQNSGDAGGSTPEGDAGSEAPAGPEAPADESEESGSDQLQLPLPESGSKSRASASAPRTAKKAVAKKASRKTTASKQAGDSRAAGSKASKKTASKKTASKKTASKKTASKKTASKKATSRVANAPRKKTSKKSPARPK